MPEELSKDAKKARGCCKGCACCGVSCSVNFVMRGVSFISAFQLVMTVLVAWTPSPIDFSQLLPTFDSAVLSWLAGACGVAVLTAEMTFSGCCGVGARAGLITWAVFLSSAAGRAAVMTLGSTATLALSQSGALAPLSTGMPSNSTGLWLTLAGGGSGLVAMANAADAVYGWLIDRRDLAAEADAAELRRLEEEREAAAMLSFLAERPELAKRVLPAAALSPATQSSGAVATINSMRAMRVALAMGAGAGAGGAAAAPAPPAGHVSSNPYMSAMAAAAATPPAPQYLAQPVQPPPQPPPQAQPQAQPPPQPQRLLPLFPQRQAAPPPPPPQAQRCLRRSRRRGRSATCALTGS